MVRSQVVVRKAYILFVIAFSILIPIHAAQTDKEREQRKDGIIKALQAKPAIQFGSSYALIVDQLADQSVPNGMSLIELSDSFLKDKTIAQAKPMLLNR